MEAFLFSHPSPSPLTSLRQGFGAARGRERKLADILRQSGGNNDERTQFVTVLEIPRVDSAQKAVQVQIVKDVKGNEK
jgi:hypothetical protein